MSAANRTDHNFDDRPCVLKPDVCKTILDGLAAGCFISTACSLAGVDRSTYYRWLRRHEAGDPAAERFAEFFAKATMTLAQFEVRTVAKVCSGNSEWRGAAWILERRFPTRWGKKVAVTHKDGDIDVSKRSDKELEAIIRG